MFGQHRLKNLFFTGRLMHGSCQLPLRFFLPSRKCFAAQCLIVFERAKTVSGRPFFLFTKLVMHFALITHNFNHHEMLHFIHHISEPSLFW
jgi:hypothetical protein